MPQLDCIMLEIAKIEAESAATIVDRIDGRNITRAELQLAFDAVADKSNWKNPIDTFIDLDTYTMQVVRHAVIFFAGCVPTFEAVSGQTTGGLRRYRVKAVGYYIAVGA